MKAFKLVKQQYANKKVLVLGLGLQGGGVSSARFFAKLGARVVVSDLKTKADLSQSLNKLKAYRNISFILGKHREQDILNADVIVQNPGVINTHPLLLLAKQHNKEIVMETAFFMRFNPAFTIGITGTRGKSTTTHLIYNILKTNTHKKVYLAGNVPNLPALPLLEKITTDDLVVLELSSWQLHAFASEKVSPNVAVLTNIYPDHLSSYKNMAEYINDKLNIIRYQTKNDVFITTNKLAQEKFVKKALRAKLISVSSDYFTWKLKYLIGKHNYENASLALKTAQVLNIDTKRAVKTIVNFPGLPFRLQRLGTIKKVLYYNDSTSTTPVACQVAIRSIAETYPDKKIVLIIGGNSKKLPNQELIKTINDQIHSVYFLTGSFTQEIIAKIKTPFKQAKIFTNIKELFQQLVQTTNTDQIVLFSPAATSFASFKNEFDRGKQFSYWFKKLQNKYGT